MPNRWWRQQQAKQVPAVEIVQPNLDQANTVAIQGRKKRWKPEPVVQPIQNLPSKAIVKPHLLHEELKGFPGSVRMPDGSIQLHPR